MEKEKILNEIRKQAKKLQLLILKAQEKDISISIEYKNNWCHLTESFT